MNRQSALLCSCAALLALVSAPIHAQDTGSAPAASAPATSGQSPEQPKDAALPAEGAAPAAPATESPDAAAAAASVPGSAGADLPGDAPADAPATPADAAGSAAAPALPSAGGPGSVEVVTDVPGANAMLDGHDVGRTPVRVDGVPPGGHRVQISREGGAPIMRDVVVRSGEVSRVDAILAGNPVRAGGATLGEAQPAPAAAPAAASSRPSLPGREFFSTFLEQPWAWAAAAVAGACLVAAALVWGVSSPNQIPVVGSYIQTDIPANAWTAVRVSVLVVAIGAGLLALGLFIWPSLPFARVIPLPTISSIVDTARGNKKPAPAPAQPAPAAQPQQQPAQAQPAPAK